MHGTSLEPFLSVDDTLQQKIVDFVFFGLRIVGLRIDVSPHGMLPPSLLSGLTSLGFSSSSSLFGGTGGLSTGPEFAEKVGLKSWSVVNQT